MLLRYFHTVRFLKPVQWRYRIFYVLRNYWRKMTGFRYPNERTPAHVHTLNLLPSIQRKPMWFPNQNRFEWLNLPHHFEKNVDWSLMKYGKLWTYNLHYFEYITCTNTQPESAVKLMEDFVHQLPNVPAANEPYPVSLRLLFWIRFFTTHRIQNQLLDRSLYAQAYALLDQQERHLLGNHYLENGFGLLFAAYRYGDKTLYSAAEQILTDELEEQILADGGHFERSPMYHQIMLYRILDTCNLMTRNPDIFDHDKGSSTGQNGITPFGSPLQVILSQKAAIMLGWLEQMTFHNGDIPLFNDAAHNIAPNLVELMEYAERLNILPVKVPLAESGYRRLEGSFYTLIADIGEIGPDYIPGHAHSDTLSFELHLHGLPFIVDTGTSTYEKNSRRQQERSTFSHNTVMINDFEQSAVWGGFRVAQRAYPVLMQDDKTNLHAAHTGYDHLGLRHSRFFRTVPGGLQIIDEIHPLSGKSFQTTTATAYLHFHPDVVFLRTGNDFIETETALITFQGAEAVEISGYEYAPEFNKLLPAQKAVVRFRHSLITLVNYRSL